MRVYADAVINHMTGSGNDVQPHRNPSGSSCVAWGAKNSTASSAYARMFHPLYFCNIMLRYFTAGYTYMRPCSSCPAKL